MDPEPKALPMLTIAPKGDLPSVLPYANACRVSFVPGSDVSVIFLRGAILTDEDARAAVETGKVDAQIVGAVTLSASAAIFLVHALTQATRQMIGAIPGVEAVAPDKPHVDQSPPAASRGKGSPARTRVRTAQGRQPK